ncbi:LacI family DNA-binding transcriptional regulator [Micromonospora soli]|uniref:LacI family DNA-binding transcriptional regulator n=1 Tax=Micromonospora sp. NBRC 110009 TaxID=3061627 RepID=UPI0026720286|nr:LacI family DNA-binding transcriptional regulator [Micromonospora sp. NBRC 110009]WKT97382.1 LacI family DNA-binding transcriptional regulator [Micromonospora sp. NBRC 110009]
MSQDADPTTTPYRPRPTLHDVAAMAGVSIKTVSRVVNGESGVTEAKVAAVRKAIHQLDYRPNVSAGALRRANRRTSAIGMVLEDLANPFSSALLRAVEDVANQRQVLILAGSGDEDQDRERALVRAFSERRVDGLIIAPVGEDQGYLRTEMEAGTPLVFVDRLPQGLLADSVLSDNEGGARAAVHHLADAGHRHVAYLGDLQIIPTAQQRFAGYHRACLERGLPWTPSHHLHDLHTVDEATEATIRLLGSDEPPTALFASQNLVTIGAIAALQQLGLEESVALVGFDDFPMADLLKPRVSVIAQDPFQIGRVAAELLFQRLDGDLGGPRRLVLPTTTIPRGSGEIPPRTRR